MSDEDCYHRLKRALRVGRMEVWDWNLPEDTVEWGGRTLRRGEFLALVHAEDRDGVSASLERAAAGEPLEEQEFRILGADGEIRWLSAAADRVGNRVAGVFADRTQFRRAREDYEQFAHAAVHELREPLRALTSFTELLAREVRSDAGASRYMPFILDGAKRMHALVEGLAALARLSGELPARGIVDCGKAVAEAIRGLGDAVERTGARIDVGDLPCIPGDAAELRRLFQNLLANSLQFRRPEAAPRIEISAERSEAAHVCLGQVWRFRVSDNGMGFDPAQAHKLFTPFGRLQGRHASGAGMGLAICRRIVERHGGRIRAEGSPGQGAVFYFVLPG